MVLEPANSLFRAAGRPDLQRSRRRGHIDIKIDGDIIRIRDQDPLHRGNVRLLDGWTFEDLVSHLNDHIFLWPGTEAGPNSYGQRHFDRYISEKPVVLRFRTVEILSSNKGAEALFSKYNSGAPRCTGGKGSPRGPRVFVNSAGFGYPASAVVEVTFRSRVLLPQMTEMARSTLGPWTRLRT